MKSEDQEEIEVFLVGRRKKISRAQIRKAKSRWRSKKWYTIYAPDMFGKAEVGITPGRVPEIVVGRNLEPSLHDITGDFSKSHIKVKLKINDVTGNNANTGFLGHRLTSDYIRRLTKRRRSKIDAIFDVITKDGAKLKVKIIATAGYRIQTSQKSALQKKTEETVKKIAADKILSEFVKMMLYGKISKKIFYACKKLYPLKRIEFRRSELVKEPQSTPDEGIEEEAGAETDEEKEGREGGVTEAEEAEVEEEEEEGAVEVPEEDTEEVGDAPE